MPNQDQEQMLFLSQLSQYLDIASEKRPHVYRRFEVEKLQEKLKIGKCSGLVALWLYYKHRNKKAYFYNSIMTPILNWDRQKKSLSVELEKTMEEALSWTIWSFGDLPFDLLAPIQTPSKIAEDNQEHKAQANISPVEPSHYEHKAHNTDTTNNTPLSPALQQTDYDVLLGLIKQNDYPTLRKEYEIAFVFTNDELGTFLKTIPSNKLIRLASSSHAIGLFFDEIQQKYTLFDPNGFFLDPNSDERTFEKEFDVNQLNDLVQNIQNAFSYEADSTVTGLTISVFDDTQKPLPAYTNRTKIIKDILDKRYTQTGKMDINASNPRDTTSALSFAANRGHLDVVEYLINQGAQIDIQNKKKETPLDKAAGKGHLPIVKVLLEQGKKISSNYTDYLNNAFYYAVISGQLPVVEFLLAQGANIELIPKASKNELSVVASASKNSNLPLLNILLNAPGGLNLINEYISESGITATPLYFAAQNNDNKTIEVLLQNGAHLHIISDLNKGPLHIAAEYNHIAALKALLESPETPQWIDSAMYDGATPLYLAAQKGHLESVQLLLKARANPKKEMKNRRGAIHTATAHGHVAVMDALLKADPNLIHSILPDGRSLLDIAIESKKVQALCFVLDRGIDIEKADHHLWNALHVAAVQGDPLMVKALLQYPMTIELLNTKTDTGKTPLQLAQEREHSEVVSILKKATQTQSETIQKAKQEIKKNWIDKDYASLVKIRALYLPIEKQMKHLQLEVMELSEYFSELREPLVLSKISSQIERLEIIEAKVQRAQALAHKKIDPIQVTNISRKEKLVSESDQIFSALLDEIQNTKRQGDDARQSLETSTKASASTKPANR